MKLAAEDNLVTEGEVLAQVPRLYEILCPRHHSEAPQAASLFPSELFDQQGRATMVAFAALARVSGRNLKFYHLADYDVTIREDSPLQLREPPPKICDATEQDLRAKPAA
jgi:hypothetical protein